MFVAFVAIASVAFGYFLRFVLTVSKRGSIELEIKQAMLSAKEEAQRILAEAEKKSAETTEKLKAKEEEKERELKKKEDRLAKKDELLDKRQEDIEQGLQTIQSKVGELRMIKEKLEGDREVARVELGRVSGLSKEEARKEILDIAVREHGEDILVRMNKLEREGMEKLDRKAKDILAASVQRLASSTASELMTSTVPLPSDELKGKIIGKEGRNIRVFEREAGVDLIVDDTPGSIVISSFDPVRRQIARVALENLILDGRIQPVKIEEAVTKAREDVGKIIKQKGEQAAFECGVFNLDPRIVSILGRLHFRTSYGQNVLQHSVEMAHISGMLAEELGADSAVARAGALLHDIGKAVDHEVQGTHVDIGRRILQKFGANPAIIAAMQSHHEEYPYETLESIIVQTADAISGGRPGARRDTVENYLKRLQDLEAIAMSFKGVEKVHALQAGREIRVFVTPEAITDMEARQMARDIALRVEKELKYPGEIKVNVIRETRVIEYAR